jgi:phosphate transport system protein
MRVRLQRDIERLNKTVISLGTLVEERFRLAVKAIECRDPELARKVIEGDFEIDQREVDLEEDCLKILALHQPVADHLRYIIAVLKLNNDLERIGDLAVNIAERAEAVAQAGATQNPFDYCVMVERTGEMLSNSLDALVNRDLNLALQVCAADDDVDVIKTAIQNQFAEEIRKDRNDVDSLISFYLVSRHLERIADHATNIAEDIIYMITGEIHRHRGASFTSE